MYTPNQSSSAASLMQNSNKSFASSSSMQTASVDEVTKSFVASLALAKSKVVNLSHRITTTKKGVAQTFLDCEIPQL
ncbi:hypothetical protein ACLB2K_022133 [Fragaria x ananassa]